MKNVFLFFILFIFSINAFAQPVLTASTNNPIVGDAFILNSCDTTGISIGTSGVGASWDFSALITQNTASFSILPCAGTSYCDSFPTSTISLTIGIENEYYITNVNEWATSGVYFTGFSGTQYFAEPRKIISYPFTYNTTIVDTSISFITPSPDLFITEIDSVIGDSYGTLILPSGTYPNALRMHLITHKADSVDGSGSPIYNRSESYVWFQPDIHFELLELDYDTSSGQQFLVQVYYLQSAASGVTRINSSNLNLEINPNPATDVINIKFNSLQNDNIFINILDFSGRIIRKINSAEIKNGYNEITYPVSNLSNGVYFIHLQSGIYNITKKVIIIH